ncbi:MAG: hypothetical protein OXG72_08390 [Acidobacteria bacterium]|nr:hypothetical protein [Acidobacteriota bacterium]
MPETREIRARIHADTIQKTTRFFDASVEEAIGELLQNARRAGAATVEVRTEEDQVELVDNGSGVEDPAALLAFGRSNWKGEVASEDPAGMELYALARYRPTICSRTAGGAGWRVGLTEEHFRGERAAPVVPDQSAPQPSGTRITFRHGNAKRIQTAVRERGRFVPTIVQLDGTAIPQAVFIGDEGRVHEWEGALIAVYHDWLQPRSGTEVSFHGHNVLWHAIEGVRTPGDRWWVRIDISRCPQVELTLPRRDALVENAFLERLKVRVRKAIYETMAEQTVPVTLTYAQWAEARRLGVPMPEAPARLDTWRPATADRAGVYFSSGESSTVNVDAMHTLGPAGLEPAGEQVLARALEGNPGHGLHLLQRNDDYQGFSWYDRLRRIGKVEVETTTGQTTRRLPMAGQGTDFENERVDSVTVVLHTIDPESGKISKTRLATDVGLAQPRGECGGENTGIKMTRTSNITVDDLAKLLGRAYFHTTASTDDDEQRHERFTEDAEDAARRLLGGTEEANLEAIRRSVDKETAWRVPGGHRATIVIEHDWPTSVVIEPTPPANA